VSETGIKESDIGPTLIANGYDINCKENLVYLPSTLEGACHLSVQLHRSDHTFKDPGADGVHSRGYHEVVTDLLDDLMDKMDVCDLPIEKRRKRVTRKMKNISRTMLDGISSFDLALTSIYKSFEDEADAHGCRNAQTIPGHGKVKKPCQYHRDHIGRKHRFGKSSPDVTIEFEKTRYELELGR
jgi:hypothetical protein